jgi:uncharacterized damage-inducible protein DinB
MMYTSIPQIFETIDETRERIYQRAESLSEDELNARPDRDAWSIAEIIEHLAVIEGRLLGMMKMMLTKAEGASAPDGAEASRMQPFSMEQFTERARKEKYIAPESVQPSGKESLPDSLIRLRRTREELRSLLPRIEAVDLSSVTYPHPAFGPLNFYQWLAFIGIHEERHLRQMEKALSA